MLSRGRGADDATECGTISNQNDITQREGTRPIDVRSIVEEYDDRPDECTLYAASVAEHEERVASWITARRGSFVDRAAIR